MKQIIDLTYTIQNGMLTYPTHYHPFTEIVQLGRHGVENRESRKVPNETNGRIIKNITGPYGKALTSPLFR